MPAAETQDSLIFETPHWLVSHRHDARYPGYLIVGARESGATFNALSTAAMAALGPVLQQVEVLFERQYAPCRVICYKLGFSSGFGCHFHMAAVTQGLLEAIYAHPEYSDAPDGNDAILFLSREYCERPLDENEQAQQRAVIEQLKLQHATLQMI